MTQLPKISVHQKTQENAPRLFLVGIGGIGMSGLAQLLRYAGYEVAGSDRAYNAPDNAWLFDALRRQGIAIYPQDGSGVKNFKPDLLIASSAVEEGNPDFIEGIPIMHRAAALAQALDLFRPEAKLIAVAGSCGKTSTTGWIASALEALGQRVLLVNGGYNVLPEDNGAPGNFHHSEGKPQWLIAEVDESDKSLVNFTPDYAMVLNVGNDHYEEAELRRVFAQFLSKAKSGIVIQDALQDILSNLSAPRLGAHIQTFGTSQSADCVSPQNYACNEQGIVFETTQFGKVKAQQYGRHSAQNACAVLALLSMLDLGKTPAELAASLFPYRGIRQRFEIMGTLNGNIPAINDYAHNPEKIAAAISTAQERYGSPLLAIFQPHGFNPLKFMREALVETLATLLHKDDMFLMLPVYYAGGTAAFKPTSDEVAEDLRKAGINALATDRDKAAKIIKTTHAKAVLVMGARDISLRSWTGKLTY